MKNHYFNKGVFFKLPKNDVIRYGGYHPCFQDEIEYFEEGKVYSIQIESNLDCDQQCKYCYVSSASSQTEEMPKDDIFSIFDSAVEMEVKNIDWIGGDPLIREDWYELMQYAEKKGLKNNIWTSGIPLKEEVVARQVVKITEGGICFSSS